MLMALASCIGDFPLQYLDEIDPQIVIESVLRDDRSSIEVYVSETLSLNDTSRNFKGINDAKVSISDQSGNLQELNLTNEGTYSTESIKKEVGAKYTLQVEVGENLYVAEEEMYENNLVDSFYVEYFENRDFYEDGYYILSTLEIIEDSKEFFRLILTVNDTVMDNYVNLLLFETSLLVDEIEVIVPYDFKPGDVVKMELFSMSEELYRYWNSYYNITSGLLGNPTAPSQNPPSNISGGCLGYFQVSSVKTFTIEIPY